MKKPGSIQLLAVTSLFALILPLQSASADSAFDWGRWDSNTQSAEEMLATSDGMQTSLNQGAVCMMENCSYDKKPGFYSTPSLELESDPVQVACGATDTKENADCKLGHEFSQK